MTIQSIDGHARTVRELRHGKRFTIDSYQREYAWKQRQVRELIDDLTGKFLDHYEPGHPRTQVERYGHYFLGSIVVSNKDQQRYVVDGQQRLTTLTLLLIYLHRQQGERSGAVDVKPLIFSEKYGEKRFNLDVPDRTECMNALFRGEAFDATGASESVQNLAARYADIEEHFDEELCGEPLPYFLD